MKESFEELLKVLKTLRGKEGCAWDKEQTVEGYVQYIIAEAKEVEEAVQKKDYKELQAELGDLFYNVLQLAAIAEEAGHFEMKDVLIDIRKKMIHRHPHVFDPNTPHTTDVKEIAEQWERIKKEEKNGN